MGTIFKVFTESVTILSLFYVFGHEACGILVPWLGIEPTPPAIEGEVLTAWTIQGSPHTELWYVVSPSVVSSLGTQMS